MSGLARRLLDRTGKHVVVSLYLDLDPREFATAPARATQIRSLLDEAHRAAEADDSLEHDAKLALRDDLERIEAYLGSDELPVSRARAVAVFASGGDDLFETVALSVPAGPSVTLAREPMIEPLVAAPGAPAWCAVLAALDRAEILLGSGARVTAHERSEDYVRGHGAEGGPTGHDEEQDIEDHLIGVAARLHRDWQRARFSVLALGGPVQAAAHLEGLLHADLRPALLPQRLEVDPSAAGDPEVAAAVAALVDAQRERAHRELLASLADALGAATDPDRRARAVAGADATDAALREQRVSTLLLGGDFTGPDREAAIRAAVRQDADVVAFDDEVPELPPARPVAALLRF
jgi:hypothetical protein